MRCDARTLKEPQEKGDKTAMGADLDANHPQEWQCATPAVTPIRGCVLGSKRPRFPDFLSWCRKFESALHR